MPIVRLDSTGQQAIIKIGSGNPRFHYGVSNNVQWRGFQFYGLDYATRRQRSTIRTKDQRSYQYNRSVEVDQVGKPDSLKKTVDYYALVYNGNAIEDCLSSRPVWSSSASFPSRTRSFVNLGAYVDSGTMVDTWATVGSCAQIGKNCHLPAAPASAACSSRCRPTR